MRCGKCSLGHSRRPEIVCQRSAEAFRSDRAPDVRSRPESETFFESSQAITRPWLVEKDCICRFLPEVSISFSGSWKNAQKKMVSFGNKATGRLVFGGCSEEKSHRRT